MKSEYVWERTETKAHEYLFPGIIKVLDKFNVQKDAYILDAGCGGGYIVGNLYKLGYSNIYGFDVSTSGIEVAQKSYPEIAERFIVHDGYEEKLPAGIPEKYDVVLSVEVIEHMFLPRVYLKNLKNWLKDNGLLVLTTPYHGYFKNLLIAILNKYDSHHNPLWDFGHIKFFSKSTLFKILEETGFQPVYFQGLGRIPFLWKSMLIVAKKSKGG